MRNAAKARKYLNASAGFSAAAAVLLWPCAVSGQSVVATGDVTPSPAVSPVWNILDYLSVGSVGTGTLKIENGGTVSSELGVIGYNEGSSGTVTVTGENSTWMNSGYLYVGLYGTGTLNIENGGTVSNGISVIGYNEGSSGTVTVTGENSTWTNSAYLYVGDDGTGTLHIENGGTVSSGWGYIGFNADSSGTVTVTGENSTWTNGGYLFVGYGGTGTLNIENGGTVSSRTGYIGDNADSIGTVTVTGENSTWTNSSNLFVGYFGTGTLNIENGGTVSSEIGYIGFYADSIGTVTVTGENSTWTNSGYLFVGYVGGTALTIENDGVVGVGGGISINSLSSLELNSGGTLRALSDQTNWITGDGALTFGAGGGKIDTREHAVTISKAFTGSGGLTKLGTGTLTLTAANTYAGGTTVKDGTLRVSGANAGITHTEANFIVGEASGDTAAMVVSGGGKVSNANAAIANGEGSTGTVTVTGEGSTWTSNYLDIGGYNATGALNIENGGTVSSEIVAIGFDLGSVGTATVAGVKSIWNNTYNINVGFIGEGRLAISDGGTVSGMEGYIGYHDGSSGTVTVDGEGSTWINEINLSIASYGNTGTLTISDGGKVSSSISYIGYAFGANGAVTVKGTNSLFESSGDLILSGDSLTNGVRGTGTLTIADGGTVSVGGTTRVHQNGTIQLNEGGVLRTHHLNFTDGTFNFAGGTLIASGTITGDLDVTENGVFSGTPTIAGNVVNAGTAAPGNSPGVMNVEGDFTQTETGRIVMEIGGTAQGTEYDFLSVSGHLHFDGILEIVKLGTFELTEGEQFQLFAFESVSGEFTSIEAFDPGNGLIWDFSRLNSEGLVFLTLVPEPAHYALAIGGGLMALIAIRGVGAPGGSVRGTEQPLVAVKPHRSGQGGRGIRF